MNGRVVNGEPIPDLAADLLTKRIGQRLAIMRVEIVHDQMNRLGCRVLHGHFADEPRQFKGRSIGGGSGEVAACLGFHRAENISRTTALVFAVSPGLPPRRGRGWRSDIGMQRYRLLVQTHHRLLSIIRAFISLQDVFHLLDVLVGEVGDAPHFFPATAGGRGAATGREWSLSRCAAPVVV